MLDIAVIGGGASGLVAAITAAKHGANVAVFESSDRVGSKILATGNGRCNLTNMQLSAADYNAPEFVAPALGEWTPAAVRDWFAAIGLLTVEERQGRVYPLSNSSHSVVDVLRAAACRAGVRIETEHCCAGIRRVDSAFELRFSSVGGEDVAAVPRPVAARKVIVACGGGSTLLQSCGHALVPPSPVLCALATNTAPIRGLSGVRAQVELALLPTGTADAASEATQPAFRERGEALFRDYGVSGIVVFNASRFAQPGQRLQLNFMPGKTQTQVQDLLAVRAEWAGSYQELLCGVFHPQLNRAIARAAGCKLSLLPDARGIARLAQQITAFSLSVEGPANTKAAQLTRGGAATSELNPKTLQSRLAPGLYAAGECMDVDGPCGGYNLHWAWASGLVAGRSACE